MDYKKFIDRKTAYDGFVKYRKKLFDAEETGQFDEVFADICTQAMMGDAIAEDCVAYFYSKGIPDFLNQNYELYMSWQVLAAANGNCFSIEKLEFFLKFALDLIFAKDDILKFALMRGNINKDNALYVISNLLCEGIVDNLKINPKELIQQDNIEQPYSLEVNRKFVKALEDSVIAVAKYLIS